MSRIWDHFTKNVSLGKVECKFCHLKIPLPNGGSTGNLWQHLKNAHPEATKEKPNSYSAVEILPSSSTPISSLFVAPKSLINRRLVEYICSTGIPLNSLDNPNFRNFCKSLNSNIEIPSRTKAGSLISHFAREFRTATLARARKAGDVVLSADCWTSPKNRVSLMAVHVHFMENNDRVNILADCIPLNERYGLLY